MPNPKDMRTIRQIMKDNPEATRSVNFSNHEIENYLDADPSGFNLSSRVENQTEQDKEYARLRKRVGMAIAKYNRNHHPQPPQHAESLQAKYTQPEPEQSSGKPSQKQYTEGRPRIIGGESYDDKCYHYANIPHTHGFFTKKGELTPLCPNYIQNKHQSQPGNR